MKNKTKKEKVRAWFGLAFMLLAGSGLHFVYDLWPNWLTAWIAPVNESIFEHTKLLFFPPLLWMLILWGIGERGEAFLSSRIYPTLIGAAFMVTGYYLYSGIIGEHYMTADIILFVISVLLNWLLTLKDWKISPLAGEIAVFLMLGVYLITAYAPPHIAFFRDSQIGNYGIG